MGHAIPRQQPAVVLRSQFNKLRALLAVALVAVVGLTVAVVMLASDSDEVTSTSAAKPIESINYGDSNAVNPSTGYPSAELRPESPSARYDGGPVSRYEAEGKHFIVPPTGSSKAHDGGSPGGTGGALKDYSKNAATGDYAHGPLPPDPAAKDYSKNGATGDYAHGPLPPDPAAKDYSKNSATGD